jgi:hypothetical protein
VYHWYNYNNLKIRFDKASTNAGAICADDVKNKYNAKIDSVKFDPSTKALSVTLKKYGLEIVGKFFKQKDQKKVQVSTDLAQAVAAVSDLWNDNWYNRSNYSNYTNDTHNDSWYENTTWGNEYPDYANWTNYTHPAWSNYSEI